MADEATAHNQAAYDQIAGQYASRRAGAGLAVVTMTEEITSRHWLKILAEVR